MFILTSIKDLIQITPQNFTLPSGEALRDAINKKYADKIIHNIGLCIVLYDILSTSEGLIGHGTGLVNVNAEFRMVVFRPFRGEILQGRIKEANEEGCTIDMDFTQEIWVPKENLPPYTRFDHSEGVFIWQEPGADELFFDLGEPVLFRVEQEEWIDQQPTVIQKNAGGEIIERRDTSYRIIASMVQNGLGPTLWWDISRPDDNNDD